MGVSHVLQGLAEGKPFLKLCDTVVTELQAYHAVTRGLVETAGSHTDDVLRGCAPGTHVTLVNQHRPPQ